MSSKLLKFPRQAWFQVRVFLCDLSTLIGIILAR